MIKMRRHFAIFAALMLAALLLVGACSPDLKEVKSTLQDSAFVGIAYEGHGIAMLDRSIDGRLGLRPDLAVPDAYQAVGLSVRDAFRAHSPGAIVDLIDPQSGPAQTAAHAAADVLVRVKVEGAYFCEGGLVHRQTCVLSMRADLLIEDRQAGTNTPLSYDFARRSGEIPGSENWATISMEQARRAVPASSLASVLAEEVRRDLEALLSEQPE